MSAHTPGPWMRCGEERGGCKCGHVWDATGYVHVATAEYVGMAAPDDLESQEVYVQSLDEAKANAQLIAAAPDLYVLATHPVLEQVLLESDHPSVKAIFEPMRRAAVAKAEGRAPSEMFGEFARMS